MTAKKSEARRTQQQKHFDSKKKRRFEKKLLDLSQVDLAVKVKAEA
jgi:hypothetical protein